MDIIINLSDQEQSIAEKYAKSHSISLENAFKQALFERIEDEYDITIFDEAYNEYRENRCKSMPIENLY